MRACIERVSVDILRGWAVNHENLSERLSVRLILDDSVIATTVADLYREDLRLNAVGDGQYGYAFETASNDDLVSAFLAGRIQVQATDGRGSAILATPADYLHQQLMYTSFLEKLQSSSFDKLLDFVYQAKSSERTAASLLSDILNVSRAHFPEWSESPDFLQLSIELCELSGRPRSRMYYQRYLETLRRPEPPPPPSLIPVEQSAPPFSYGSFREWSSPASGLSIEIVRPRFVSGENVQSFIEEAGILINQDSTSRRLKVLAYREYAWGAPSWTVLREGSQIDVARNLYYLDFELMLSVLEDKGFLIIDMSNEGPIPEPQFIRLLNDAMHRLELNPNQVLLITQNLTFDVGADNCRFVGHVSTAHFFISKSLRLLKSQFPTDEHIARHCHLVLTTRGGLGLGDVQRYLCMNFTPRWSRWATVLFLSWKGYLKDGYCSFPGETNSKMEQALPLDRLFPPIENREQFLLHIPDLLRKCPLELDVKASELNSPDFVYPMELTTRSLFHIVTESEMTDGTVVRVTEKILKPLVGLQPFIVIGNPGSLQLLRHLGFKTFDSLIDESYDSMNDPGQRMNAVFNQIDRLMQMPIEALRVAVEALNETLIFNFVHLMKMGPLLFNTAVQRRLEKIMASYARDSAGVERAG